MSLTLTGIVIRGTQAASGQKHWIHEGGTIRMQERFFVNAGIDLRGIYFGTINVSIDPLSFSIQAADYYVPGVAWHPVKSAENFSFVKCLINFNQIGHKGYLYYPHPETKIPGQSV